MIKKSSIKNYVNEILENRGANPQEIQVSNSTIIFIASFLEKETEDLINKVVDHIISNNSTNGRKKLRRITPRLLKVAIFSDLTEKELKNLLSGVQKPQNRLLSDNHQPISRVLSENSDNEAKSD